MSKTRKRKFAVYPRSKSVVRDGLTTGKGHRKFKYNHSLMNISDPAEAAEIEDKYGAKGSQDVYVVEDERYAHATNGEVWDVKGSKVETLHHYTFGQMGLDLPDRKSLIGKVKIISGDEYVYRMRNGKLKLERKPTRRRSGARKGAEVVGNVVPD